MVLAKDGKIQRLKSGRIIHDPVFRCKAWAQIQGRHLGGVECCQCASVASFNFQLGEGDGMCEWVSDGVKSEARWRIGSIGIGNIITLETLTASHDAEAIP